MPLQSDLRKEVEAVFAASWTDRDGQKVPEATDIALGNDAVKLDATVLYADLDGSTSMVDSQSKQFSAEIYKTFLHCAAKIIKSEGGVITAYDGDRIMAVYLGGSKNTSAARTALKINWARIHIINPAIKKQYPQSTFEVKHVCGIDTSSLYVARTGVRGDNDLVWVGRSANYAAKLASLPATHASQISQDVYNQLHADLKTSSDGRAVWEKATWTDMNKTIYRSTWLWRVY